MVLEFDADLYDPVTYFFGGDRSLFYLHWSTLTEHIIPLHRLYYRGKRNQSNLLCRTSVLTLIQFILREGEVKYNSHWKDTRVVVYHFPFPIGCNHKGELVYEAQVVITTLGKIVTVHPLLPCNSSKCKKGDHWRTENVCFADHISSKGTYKWFYFYFCFVCRIV